MAASCKAVEMPWGQHLAGQQRARKRTAAATAPVGDMD